MNKKLSNWNPNNTGIKGQLFGKKNDEKESNMVIVPVPLDVTTSYGSGTSDAPECVLQESSQIDLSIPFIQNPWELNVAWTNAMVNKQENKQFRSKAKKLIISLESGMKPDDKLIDEVNIYTGNIHRKVEEITTNYLSQGKWVGVVGGDHSVGLGLIRTLNAIHRFGILQIDAHKDLRANYQGFADSHASIMRNVIKLNNIQSLSQVGIRDYCEEESQFIQIATPIHTFFDEVIWRNQQNGMKWNEQMEIIVSTLPKKVYISFDMDGLDPSLCPHTGTPVPGGLSFHAATSLIQQVVNSGRKIIGFDLCETGASPWDANVAARILYRLCIATGMTHGLIRP